MANIFVTEYNSIQLGMPGYAAPIPLEPAVANQNVSFTTATQSVAFNASTRFVRLFSTANCHVVFGANPTATAAKQKLIAEVEYWRGVVPGQKVSVYDGSS